MFIKLLKERLVKVKLSLSEYGTNFSLLSDFYNDYRNEMISHMSLKNILEFLV